MHRAPKRRANRSDYRIADAAPVAKKHDSTVVAIYELAAFVAEQGVKQIVGMNLGGTVQLEDVAATMVSAT